MIRVQKSLTPPTSLTRDAPAAQAKLEEAYDKNPAGCQQPATAALKARRGVYAAKDVKKQLRDEQHGKCAYCETKFLHSSPGDVEHHRPKAGYRQAATSPVEGPGYYWLAYEWSNLLFACEDCNRIRKRQLFPLANEPAGRAHSHHHDLTREQPLLLNPATGPDPEAHLTFVEEAAKGITVQGRASVAAYDLNRVALLEDWRERMRHLQNSEMLARLFEANPPIVNLEKLIRAYGSVEQLSWHIAQATKSYNRAALDTAEYASMVRANFPLLQQH